MELWASEPAVTYTGVGIGNNMYNSGSGVGFTRRNTSRGGSYIRLLEGGFRFNVVDGVGADINALAINSTGNVGIGDLSPSKRLTVASPSGDYGQYIYGNGVAGNNNGILIDAGLNASDYGLRIRSGASAEYFAVRGDGNVGIGTTTPLAKLEVAGNVMVGATNKIGFNYAAGNSNFYNFIEWQSSSNALNIAGGMWTGSPSQEAIRFSTVGGAKMSILNSGNVGIGTASPSEKLHVVGGNVITYGWTTVAKLEANYPVLLFNGLSGSKHAGIGYDGTSGMNFWVNGSSSDVAGTGSVGLHIKGSNAFVGIGNTTPSEKLDVTGTINATQYKLSALNTAPATATSTGTLGEVRITATYIYVCTATNTWVRSALATW